MTDAAARRRVSLTTKILVSIPLAIVVGGVSWILYEIAHMDQRFENANRSRVRSQVANVVDGSQHNIYLSNEIGKGSFEEFVRLQGELDKAAPFRLDIEYSHRDVDDFFDDIRGLHSLRTLSIRKSNATDA